VSEFPEGAHERHLARYRRRDVEVFCSNEGCVNAAGATVLYEEEYGQGWLSPEECPACGHPWADEEATT
jgi:hypothetical protein